MDEAGTLGVGHNHNEAAVLGDVIPSVALPNIPSVALPNICFDTATPLYKSLDDEPFLVKDNFRVISQALFDTDGGSTHAYACLRGHSVEFYHYVLLRSITDTNLFDTIRYIFSEVLGAKFYPSVLIDKIPLPFHLTFSNFNIPTGKSANKRKARSKATCRSSPLLPSHVNRGAERHQICQQPGGRIGTCSQRKAREGI